MSKTSLISPLERNKKIKKYNELEKKPQHRVPAETVPIHIEDGHDVEAELVEESCHHRIILV